MEFLNLFENELPFVKIGMELFYSEGPSIVRRIKERGHRIFLDLKLHDIPNTVMKAMRALSRLGTDMVNVHAAGGSHMMSAALSGLMGGDGSPPAPDRGNAAYLHGRSAHARRASDRGGDGGNGGALCA